METAASGQLSIQPCGVMFHHFHGGIHPVGQGSLSESEFGEILNWIEERCSLLPAREWADRAWKGSLRAGEVCLTFDDNLRCQFDIAYPVLKRRGLTAFWFVYTSIYSEGGRPEKLEVYRYYRTTAFPDVEHFYDAFERELAASSFASGLEKGFRNFEASDHLKHCTFYSDSDRRFRYLRDIYLGRRNYEALMDTMVARSGLDTGKLLDALWMNQDQLRQLAQEGHVVGAHSFSHPTAIAGLSPSEQRTEYSLCARDLTEILGERPVAMSHPCNSYNSDTLDVLKDLGFRLGFRANLETGYPGILEFPREDHANLARQVLR